MVVWGSRQWKTHVKGIIHLSTIIFEGDLLVFEESGIWIFTRICSTKFTSSRTKNIQFSADFFVSLSMVNGVYSPKRHDSVNKTLGSVACSLSPLDDSVPKTGCFPMKSGQSPWHQQMGFNQRNQLKVSNVHKLFFPYFSANSKLTKPLRRFKKNKISWLTKGFPHWFAPLFSEKKIPTCSRLIKKKHKIRNDILWHDACPNW